MQHQEQAGVVMLSGGTGGGSTRAYLDGTGGRRRAVLARADIAGSGSGSGRHQSINQQAEEERER